MNLSKFLRSFRIGFLGFAHALHVRKLDVPRSLVDEHLAEQARISEVVLDEEEDLDRFRVHLPGVGWGNLTLVSQKSLMLFTSASNSSS